VVTTTTMKESLRGDDDEVEVATREGKVVVTTKAKRPVTVSIR
jgi:hypothetical protein